MNKIIAYKNVFAETLCPLEEKVNNNIAKGWVPIGGVFKENIDGYIQSMVRYEVEE